MRKLFLALLLGFLSVGLHGADAANDVVLSQRNSGNTGFTQRNVGASGAITNTATFRSQLGIAGLADANVFTAVNTFLGSFISTPAPITLVANSGTLDITDRYSSVTVTANSTLAPSAAGADGQTCAVKVTNAQATSLTLTMNNSGTDYVTTIPVGFVWITYISNGTDWIPTVGSPASGTVASTSLLYFSNPTTRVDSTTTVADLATVVRTTIVEKLVTFSIDGAGAAITTSTISGVGRVPYACTLTGWSIDMVAATGTTTIKIWNVATGTAIPAIGNVINTNGVSLTTGTAVQSNTITDFTDTTFAAYDMFRCAITAADGTATSGTVTLYGTRL